MSAFATVISAVIDAMTPDATLSRMRVRTTVDMVTTLVVTLLAIVLTVGYQVLGRWPRRNGPSD